MRQLWPLNRASLETGPWYPFDNGPNGVNTLVGPQWLTSQGLLVMTDPDTPFLHVGMNAPRGGDGVGWVQRSWCAAVAPPVFRWGVLGTWLCRTDACSHIEGLVAGTCGTCV